MKCKYGVIISIADMPVIPDMPDDVAETEGAIEVIEGIDIEEDIDISMAAVWDLSSRSRSIGQQYYVTSVTKAVTDTCTWESAEKYK